jgi:E3 ubiquitin-protein ligase HERC2
VDRLQAVNVIKVFCGAQFSLALTNTGALYSWGKGDGYRLGHGSEEHVRFPKPIQGLTGDSLKNIYLELGTKNIKLLLPGKKVVSVAVGSSHVLVRTDEGEVLAWGQNDQNQLIRSSTQPFCEPTGLPYLQNKSIIGIACGPYQVIFEIFSKYNFLKN